MQSALQAAALVYLAFAVSSLQRRPGFLAATLLSSFGLAVFYGPIGAFSSIVALLATIHAWISRDRCFVPVPGELPLLCWLLVTIASAFVSWEIEASIELIVSLIFLCGSSYLVGRTFGMDAGFLRDLLTGSCLILLLCLPMLVLMQDTVARLGTDSDQNPVGLASIVEIPMIGALAIIFFDHGRAAFTKFVIGAILLFIVVPFSFAIGTRSLIVAALAVFLLFLLIKIRHGNFGAALAWTAFVTVLVAMIAAVAWSELAQTRFGGLMQFGIDRILLSVFHPEAVAPSNVVRIAAYTDAYQLFLSSPLVGHGLGSFYYLADNSGGAYVHNLFLEILVDTGLVGLLLFLVPALRFGLFALSEAFRKPSWQNALLLGMIVDAGLRHQVSLSVTFGKLLFFSFGILAAKMQLNFNLRKGDAPEIQNIDANRATTAGL